MSRVDASRPRSKHSTPAHDESPGAHLVRALNGVIAARSVRAAPPDHREPAKRAARPDRREPDVRELAAALAGALHRKHPHHEGVNPRVPPVREATEPWIDWSFATQPAKTFALKAGHHVFDPLIGAAIAKNNEQVYGRPNESLGGRS
jgi:hypothetical protein